MGKRKKRDRDNKRAAEINPDGRMLTWLNSCVHCGLCGPSCLFWLASGGDPKMVPGRKVDLVASLYRRQHTIAGKFFPWLTGAGDLSDEKKAEMVDLLYGACSMCGRCSLHCSIGINVAEVVRRGRTILSDEGEVPETLNKTVRAAMEKWNNMAIPVEELTETLEWLEEDLQLELNDNTARIPLNESGKRVIYTLNPREPKFFPLSITAMAKIFHLAGESWTLSTKMYDITNYAFFSGNNSETAEIVKRLSDEAVTLGAELVVLAECGHGSRVFRWEGPNYLGKSYPFDVETSVELIKRYLDEGKIKPDKSKNRKRVTLHDPCNLARSGGIIGQQRDIIESVVTDFVEMSPHGADNFCCGGGGGQLSMSEYNERRMSAGKIKADQIEATGAEIVVTPCHNCVDQLLQITQAYKLKVKIVTMAEIVAEAL